MHDRRPGRAAELRTRLAEQQQRLAVRPPAAGDAAADVLVHAEHADDRRRVDRDVAGLVVEADVAAGDRQAELAAAVGQAADGLGELPHDLGLLRGAEVQAVGDGERLGAGDGDVAVGLGQVQLRAGVRVEPGVAGVAVERERDAAVRLLVDADDAGVLGLGEHGVAAHVAVVLLGDPGLVRAVGAGDDGEPVRLELRAGARAGQARRRRRPAGRRGRPGGPSAARRPGPRGRPCAAGRRRSARRASRR